MVRSRSGKGLKEKGERANSTEAGKEGSRQSFISKAAIKGEEGARVEDLDPPTGDKRGTTRGRKKGREWSGSVRSNYLKQGDKTADTKDG